MNAKKAKQARRLAATIFSASDPEKLKPYHVNVHIHRVSLPLTREVFVYETATVINPRRRAYRKIKRIIREMPRLV